MNMNEYDLVKNTWCVMIFSENKVSTGVGIGSFYPINVTPVTEIDILIEFGVSLYTEKR